MLFNSLHFLGFFPAVCILFRILPQRYRNLFLLTASYYFYMSWKPVYGLLILFSSFVTWIASIYIDKQSERKAKKKILVISLIANFAVLFVFKDADFFSTLINQILGFASIRMQLPSMELLLPIGISFYTLQVTAYVIDVYRGEIQPERSFLRYALFAAFFPQLVAGPIERAKNLLPQFHREYRYDGKVFFDGIKIMAWGYFMKLCIADRLAPYVDAVFNNYQIHNGASLLLGTFFFTFQIFCDFAGYSLIALGTAKCLGFDLTLNFKRPYLSPDIKTFWRRWHCSLSSWFADYVYIPLGGNRCTLYRHLFNLFITFVISGLWHGANWTFLIWGAYHGLLIIFYVLKNRLLPEIKAHSPFQTIISVFFTLIIVMFGWIFFRANDVEGAFSIVKKIFTEPGMLYRGNGIPDIILALFCIGLLMFKEIKDEMAWNIHLIHNKNEVISVISLSLLISFIILSANFSGGAFIYFQF
ncbi:MAG: MBOAT family protein [Dysgonamonadaceae bacterium]|nr:MBOAT family protein [Dysgonamonadaceae bacterium]